MAGRNAPDWIEHWNRVNRVVTMTLVGGLLLFMLWKSIYP